MKIWDLGIYEKNSVSILRLQNLPIPSNVQEKWLPLLEAAHMGHIDSPLYQYHICMAFYPTFNSTLLLQCWPFLYIAGMTLYLDLDIQSGITNKMCNFLICYLI